MGSLYCRDFGLGNVEFSAKSKGPYVFGLSSNRLDVYLPIFVLSNESAYGFDFADYCH